MTMRKVIAGLVVVHVLWAAAFLVGSLLLGDHFRMPTETGAFSARARTMDFVIATALGMAITRSSSAWACRVANPFACSVTWILIVAVLFRSRLACKGRRLPTS